MNLRVTFAVLATVVAVSAGTLPTSAEASYAKATYHGKTFCPKGSFFDPRNGGECWSCPSGTHRTVFPVTGSKACERRAYSKWSKATYKGKAKTSKPQGAFFDPRKGGEWWKCPSNRPRRTAYAVTDHRACATKNIIGEKLSKAEFLGKVNRPKPSGAFFDPRKGGEYWECPRGYKRTVLSVTDSKACEQVVKASLAKATYNRKFGCGKGQFFDPRNGGECWSCPGNLHRTTRAVTSGQACTNKIADIFVDTDAMCRTIITGIAKGTDGMNALQKEVDKFTAPLMKPVNDLMSKVSAQVKSPKELDDLGEKLGNAVKPYEREMDQFASMAARVEKNGAGLRKTLLNPSLVCDGNSSRIIAELKKAGADPNRKASILDGLFIGSAHAKAKKRVFYAFSLTNEGRPADKPVGLTLGFTLVTDFVADTGLFFSIGPYTSTRPGFSGAFDFMVFPSATIEDFDAIQALGVAVGFAPGETIEKMVRKWPPKVRNFVLKLPGGLSVSMDPLFKTIPGFGTTIISGASDVGKGKIGLVDITASVDMTFLLTRFK